MSYRPLDMPFDDHRAIRKLPDIKAACEKIGHELAREAGAIAGDPNGYKVVTVNGADRVRVYVQADSGKAIRAEAKTSPLMQLSAKQGPHQ